MDDGSGRALRIGLLVPANNTTVEQELPAWLPVPATCRTLRIPRPPGLLTRADVPAYVDAALALARTLDDAVDVVVYGCTAAGFLAGPAEDARIAEALGRITGKPVVTTAGAMNAALRAIDAREVAVVTPYSDEVNERLTRFLADAGIAVRRLASLGAGDVAALGAITAEQVEALAERTMDPDCDALFIACSQLPTRAVLPRLEQRFGRPAWSSIRATARAVEQALAPAA